MDAKIILLPEFDAELKEFNIRLGKGIEPDNGNVIYISIKEIRPKFLARVGKIEFESTL